MKTDIQIQKDVMEELRWDPLLKAAEIGVAVNNGVVTLSGQVDSYIKKVAAEKDARKVSGVKGVAEDLRIRFLPVHLRTDSELAEAVSNTLKWHAAIQDEKIRVKVEKGVVTLEGEVDWEFERANAEKAIQNLQGVSSIINLIGVKPKFSHLDIHQKIKAALQRNAAIDANKISVEISGSKVILRGKVRSFAEKEDAEVAAWNAPGVISVESYLDIEEPEYEFNSGK